MENLGYVEVIKEKKNHHNVSKIKKNINISKNLLTKKKYCGLIITID